MNGPLSEQQRTALIIIAREGECPSFKLSNNGVANQTTASLLRRGLATLLPWGGDNFSHFKITDAGRAAIAPPAWMVAGACANYHAIIGGPVTRPCLRLSGVPFIQGDHWSVFFVEHYGSVYLEAVSRCTLGHSTEPRRSP